MDAINYPLILVAALAAIASPGPATLAMVMHLGNGTRPSILRQLTRRSF
ncbi:hypothetical protein [uncultured Vibrio sp.]|nr:hypothetical protein [uncultured Vibrio sp.]